jgi:hypothetical protein
VFPTTSLNQAVNGGGGNRTRVTSPYESLSEAITVHSPFSTGAVKTPAPGPQLPPGGSYPVRSSHLRGHGRAHPRSFRWWGVLADAAREGTPPDQIAAPSSRNADVLPAPSLARADTCGSASVGGRPRLGADRSSGARRDTGAAGAAVELPGMVGRPSIDRLLPGDRCVLHPRARVDRLGLEPFASPRPDVLERLLQRLSVRAWDVAVNLLARRTTRFHLYASRRCLTAGAAAPRVCELVEQRLAFRWWAVAELVAGVRSQVII